MERRDREHPAPCRVCVAMKDEYHVCGRRPGHTTAFTCAHVCSVSLPTTEYWLLPLSCVCTEIQSEKSRGFTSPTPKWALSSPHAQGRSLFIANPNPIPLPWSVISWRATAKGNGACNGNHFHTRIGWRRRFRTQFDSQEQYHAAAGGWPEARWPWTIVHLSPTFSKVIEYLAMSSFCRPHRHGSIRQNA